MVRMKVERSVENIILSLDDEIAELERLARGLKLSERERSAAENALSEFRSAISAGIVRVLRDTTRERQAESDRKRQARYDKRNDQRRGARDGEFTRALRSSGMALTEAFDHLNGDAKGEIPAPK